MVRSLVALALWLVLGSVARAAAPEDYERREVQIPARDGVTLHTILLVPKGAKAYPILLNRTPFNAGRRMKADQAKLADTVPAEYRELLASGYIFAFQDVRGKNGSGGEYVAVRPMVGPFNKTQVDHATDAYDTIDWLVKHTPESNGRVGVIGSSYDGFTALAALINPHPALRAAVPVEPMVDGWKGDDWFHNGAFRQVTFPFAFYFDGPAAKGAEWPAGDPDDYAALLKAGSAGAMGAAAGMDASPFWKTITSHPAYDAYWQGQAMDRRLAAEPKLVPTLHVASLWDQEDIWGAVHAYAAAEAKDKANDRNFLVIGPWSHSGWKMDGSELGPLKWGEDTAAHFRTRILRPFLDAWLKGDGKGSGLAPVTAFETGGGAGWTRHDRWPLSCARGCDAAPRRLFLHAGGKLDFTAPAAGEAASDAYLADPADPVPFSPRPNKIASDVGENWPTWLVEDQRKVSDRPDVLTYASDVLTQPLRIGGTPVAELVAASTGTDADWVVKLIDVYPADDPVMPGYQLAVSMDILRGRYRNDPAKPEAIRPGAAERYRFELPTANHVFRPGHRIMVQVQSSWFPLYDRNPQTFVPNIFFAKPEDYRAATQTVMHAPGKESFIELPVVK